MRDNLSRITKMDWELKHSLMEIHTEDSTRKEDSMERECIFGVQAMHIKDNFMKDANMAKGFGLPSLEKPIKDTIKTIRNAEVESINGAMAAFSKVNFKMTRSNTINI